MLKSLKRLFTLLLAVTLIPAAGFAYEVPRQDSGTKFFYIFGPGGNVLDGKESNEFHLYVDVPADANDQVVIKVYDADTGGKNDAGTAPWDTEMEYSVSGTSELGKQVVGENEKLDGKNLQFGPFSKEQGEKIGNIYRFELKVKAVSGDDLNAFAVGVSPDYAESWSDKFTFFLRPERGASLHFYPEIPAGVSNVIARNYDLDKDGGVGEVRDSFSGQSFDVADSESGQWTETPLNISPAEFSRRLDYKITTTYQTRGHAGIQVTDDKGNVLPIYFKKGKLPVKPKPVKAPKAKPEPKPTGACQEFVFDGRSSYDPNKQKISYAWDFGDGTSSAEPVVKHVYEKGGNYTVTLTVKDESGLECDTAVSTQAVTVNTPPKAGFNAPDLSCVGNELVFNASATKDDNPANMTYHWDFGDGTTAEGAEVSHAFAKGGSYNVTLSVDDGAGTQCSRDAIRQVVRVNTNPVADAGKDVTVYTRSENEKYLAHFDGSKSYDADRDNLSYNWSFGDGQSAEGVKVTHEYEQAGHYTAKLTVNDNSGAPCAVAVDDVNVDLFRAPVAEAGQPQSVCSGNTVSFDGSDSTGVGTLSYNWNFGDGETGEGKNVTHTYAKGGNYKVTLTVDDGSGSPVSRSTDVTTVSVNSLPIAKLAEVEPTCSGRELSFDASASHDPDGDSLKYTWDFGDGTTSQGGSKAKHAYAKGGSYTVTVTVDDGKGGTCSVSSDTIRVKLNTPPVANAGENLTCCEERASSFDGTASSDPDGDSLTYSWDFGDGATSDDAKTSHAYAKSGNYRVTLTVDDGSGTSCSKSTSGFSANVNASPVSVIQVKQK